MDLASIPETIRTIIDQAGVLGLRGAFTYIGAQDFRYRCAQAEGEYRSGFRSRLSSEGGPPRVEFDVGLQARVNGKPGRAWTLIIVYEGDDTYTVWLVEGHFLELAAVPDFDPRHQGRRHGHGFPSWGSACLELRMSRLPPPPASDVRAAQVGVREGN